MKEFDHKKWKFLCDKYPERAGIAYEMYLRDKKKEANLVTYFNFAYKRLKQQEIRYQAGLSKYRRRNQPIKEYENEENRIM